LFDTRFEIPVQHPASLEPWIDRPDQEHAGRLEMLLILSSHIVKAARARTRWRNQSNTPTAPSYAVLGSVAWCFSHPFRMPALF
jgi:hypothetical protein